MSFYKIAGYCIIGFLFWCFSVLMGAAMCADVNNSGWREGLVIGSALWCFLALWSLAGWLLKKGRG